MEQQFVGIGYILNVEQLHLRVALGVEALVHVLKHILNANLFAVADAPYGVEGQALRHGALQNEHSRGTRAADEVGTLRIEGGNGFGENTVVPCVHQADTVRADECRIVFFTRVENLLLECSTCFGFLAKAC